MIFQAIMTCVRVVVLTAILGVIVFVIYDNIRSGQRIVNTAVYTVPKVGDTATLNNNAVACPIADDALKIRAVSVEAESGFPKRAEGRSLGA
jgi:hypothetical protein